VVSVIWLLLGVYVGWTLARVLDDAVQLLTFD
jgi:hypothetical protein